MVDDDRMPLRPGEVPEMRSVRFRTLGCYPLTGAVESDADTLPDDHPGDAADHHVGAAGPGHRPRLSRLDGEEEAGGLLLMAHVVDDLIAADIEAYLDAARAQEPAALHHLRQRRRRQEHADRPAALRVASWCSRTTSRRSRPTRRRSAPRAASSTSRCWSTVWRPSASRASPSTSPTGSSPPSGASSSSPTRPGHEQYTRNMVTGASTADLAVILDRRPQGRAHPDPAAQLPRVAARHPPRRPRGQQDGPRRLLAGGLRPRSRTTTATFAAEIGLDDITVHPDVGAAAATTSSTPSAHTPWYHGPTLLGYLETVRGRRRRSPTGRSACRCSG